MCKPKLKVNNIIQYSISGFQNLQIYQTILIFFNIQMSHVALVKDGESEWQCIALLIFHTLFIDSEKVVCDFARAEMAFSLNIFDNAKFSLFNIQISRVVLVKDGTSYWQCIALLIFQINFQRF